MQRDLQYLLDMLQSAELVAAYTQGKRKKKCAEVWYVAVKIIDS
jgi:uncharacterized protein with HEPN domain